MVAEVAVVTQQHALRVVLATADAAASDKSRARPHDAAVQRDVVNKYLAIAR